jgi:xanthine dehydrogenase YagR molybdenum-binding subunit
MSDEHPARPDWDPAAAPAGRAAGPPGGGRGGEGAPAGQGGSAGANAGGGPTYLGAPLDRVDGPLKVTGRARYAAEFGAARLAHAALVHVPVARGRVTALETGPAERAPGVVRVITSANMPPMPRPSVPPSGDGAPLLDRRILYAGQIVAVVVAETPEQAEHAAALVGVRCEAEPPVVDLERELPRAFAPATGNSPAESRRGDATRALGGAAQRVEAVYRTPTEHHNPLEPHATVAVWDGGRLTVYDATQGVSNTAQNLAELFGLEPEQVRVIDPFVGGGFGCKGQSWPHVPLTALAARVVGRPVRCVLPRRQMFFTVGHRPETRQAETLGADRDGKLVAIVHDAVNHTSEHDEFLEPTGNTASLLYACPDAAISHRLVRLNVGSPTYQRAPGESSGNFAHETAIDELAHACGLDPLEFRLRNHADTDPKTGHPWSSKSLKACYARAAEAFGWAKRDPRPGSMRDGRLRIGYGMATATYPANFRPAGAKALMHADGRVVVRCGTQDLGTGTYTILAQVAADTVGVPVGRVTVELGDSSLPNAPTSGGSCSATSAGSAVLLACRALRSRLLTYAQTDEGSPFSGVKSTAIVTREGVLHLKDDPSRRLSYVDLLARYGKQVVEQEAFAQPGRERGRPAGAPQGTEQGDKGQGGVYSMHGFGAQFCEVAVDPDLGSVRVRRWTGAFALGRVLNAKTLRSQLQGGIVWGIGMALMEESLLDPRQGRFVNTNLAEYHVPTNADVPALEVIVLDEEDEFVSPLGAKGAGEIGITGAPAAIGNAIYHATGRRLRELPFTLDRLM